MDQPEACGQWTSTLKIYAKPVIGDMRVDRIETDNVLAVLRPIWATKIETASRIRQRVEAVLDSVTVQKKRAMALPPGFDPAQPNGSHEVENFAALPYAELPAVMTALRSRHGEAARALEFTILTAARTGMTLGAASKEVDLAAGTRTVPSDRMKAKVEHTVPLSKSALALVRP